MTRAKKSYRLELTKEQQALVMQKTGMEAKELEVTADELKTRAEPKSADDRP
jgi:phosphoribosyl-ATP pyrophosphohydrolase